MYHVNYNQNKCCNIIVFGTKNGFFLPPYQIIFFQITLAFGLAKNFQLSYFIKHSYSHIFCGKKFLDNIPYKKLSQKLKQHSTIRKEHVLVKCLFDKVLQNLLYCKDIVKTYYIKGVHRVKKNILSQMFYKIGLFESFTKFTGEHLCWSQFLINTSLQRQSHVCSLVFCGRFFGVELSFFLKVENSDFGQISRFL